MVLLARTGSGQAGGQTVNRQQSPETKLTPFSEIEPATGAYYDGRGVSGMAFPGAKRHTIISSVAVPCGRGRDISLKVEGTVFSPFSKNRVHWAGGDGLALAALQGDPVPVPVVCNVRTCMPTSEHPPLQLSFRKASLEGLFGGWSRMQRGASNMKSAPGCGQKRDLPCPGYSLLIHLVHPVHSWDNQRASIVLHIQHSTNPNALVCVPQAKVPTYLPACPMAAAWLPYSGSINQPFRQNCPTSNILKRAKVRSCNAVPLPLPSISVATCIL
ncbi:hypothetical protein BKA67DRAFT_193534 [Truncatella angustata]|uniref:Uncharacterized protein n=1 Tax=Truncatella angustata TaxID=152316 RepID=A0A9P8ZZT9_9PEZI|nr:uncharacterized protein BKA67DRAFT_193534 [Truncatella angustata]KAH6657617.1 hypothetical protein BKA67DRAFT_193534 [Truncatella angustata]